MITVKLGKLRLFNTRFTENQVSHSKKGPYRTEANLSRKTIDINPNTTKNGKYQKHVPTTSQVEAQMKKCPKSAFLQLMVDDLLLARFSL